VPCAALIEAEPAAIGLDRTRIKWDEAGYMNPMGPFVRPRWNLGVRLSVVLLLVMWAALVVPGAGAAVPP
jgi:hypothetical protein